MVLTYGFNSVLISASLLRNTKAWEQAAKNGGDNHDEQDSQF
jgi:hypothetical protein